MPRKEVKSRRPRIPASVERAVLSQAGYRCSVCGDACPLERAHIIPWRESKQHSERDLICLCANCHQRADLEGWGEKTLRVFKEQPWILRRQHLEASRPSAAVRLTIDISLQEFDAVHQRLLIYTLSTLLDVAPTDIVIKSIEEGSVKVTLQMPTGAAGKLEELKDKPLELEEKLKPFVLRALEFVTSETPVENLDPAHIREMVAVLEAHMVMALESLSPRDYNLLVELYSLEGRFPLKPTTKSAEPSKLALVRARQRFSRNLEELLRSELKRVEEVPEAEAYNPSAPPDGWRRR